MALAVFPTGNINITTDLWTWRNFPSVWLKLHFCRLNLSVISQPTVTNSIFPTEENNALRWRKGEDHHTHQVLQFYELSPLQKNVDIRCILTDMSGWCYTFTYPEFRRKCIGKIVEITQWVKEIVEEFSNEEHVKRYLSERPESSSYGIWQASR